MISQITCFFVLVPYLAGTRTLISSVNGARLSLIVSDPTYGNAIEWFNGTNSTIVGQCNYSVGNPFVLTFIVGPYTHPWFFINGTEETKYQVIGQDNLGLGFDVETFYFGAGNATSPHLHDPYRGFCSEFQMYNYSMALLPSLRAQIEQYLFTKYRFFS